MFTAMQIKVIVGLTRIESKQYKTSDIVWFLKKAYGEHAQNSLFHVDPITLEQEVTKVIYSAQ
jgi:hypothetical protein